jgi:hypothetical protein
VLCAASYINLPSSRCILPSRAAATCALLSFQMKLLVERPISRPPPVGPAASDFHLPHCPAGDIGAGSSETRYRERERERERVSERERGHLARAPPSLLSAPGHRWTAPAFLPRPSCSSLPRITVSRSRPLFLIIPALSTFFCLRQLGPFETVRS